MKVWVDCLESFQIDLKMAILIAVVAGSFVMQRQSAIVAGGDPLSDYGTHSRLVERMRRS